GLLPGEIAVTPEVDGLQTLLVEELMAVVRAKRLTLPDPDPLGTIKALCRARFNRPSMMQHVEQGRRTEIDALNGALVREAARLRQAVPPHAARARANKGQEEGGERACSRPPPPGGGGGGPPGGGGGGPPRRRRSPYRHARAWPWHPRVEMENIHAEPRSTRS